MSRVHYTMVSGMPTVLVIPFTGGNYSDPALFTAQRVYVPRYLLPAVR